MMASLEPLRSSLKVAERTYGDLTVISGLTDYRVDNLGVWVRKIQFIDPPK